MITQERLKELFHYCPDTGVFTRLITTGSNGRAGDIPGSDDGQGYITVMICNKNYRLHRLAYLYMKGEFPPDQIDHISGVRTDNRWENLRAVTHQENGRNQKKSSNNKSGVSGVFWDKRDRLWLAGIKDRGKYIYLGGSSDFFESVCARKSAEVKYNYHPNHGRSR